MGRGLRLIRGRAGLDAARQRAIDSVLNAFRTGDGVPYADYGPDRHEGQGRHCRTGALPPPSRAGRNADPHRYLRRLEGIAAAEEVHDRVAGARQMLAAPSEEFDPTLPGLFAGDPPAEFVSLLEAIATAVRPESLRTQLSLDADQRDLLPDILVPTLLIWGELDARSSLSVARQFEHAIPDTKLVVIPDCGHVSNPSSPNSSTPPYASSAGPTRRGRHVRECRMSRDCGRLLQGSGADKAANVTRTWRLRQRNQAPWD